MMINPKKYKNELNLTNNDFFGIKQRKNTLLNIFEKNTPLPKPVTYQDIDNEMKKWVESDLYITCEGEELPTMTLFSNQRFSEYLQTWKYTDSDRNIIINFKTLYRDNNPQPGTNQDGLYNIPGERYYTMFRNKVLDNNGTESFVDYSIKQPFCVDLTYKVSVFTNKTQIINDFNCKINDLFKSKQCYIAPNGHYMPMIIDNISDESEYNIEDRQFFSQTYTIKLMAYIINENDFKVEEIPSRLAISFINDDNKTVAEIEENDYVKGVLDDGIEYYYKPITLTITYPLCKNTCKFTIDEDIVIDDIKYENINKNIKIFINEEEYSNLKFSAHNGDQIRIKIKKYNKEKNAKLILLGYNPNNIYSSKDDLPEIQKDFKQKNGEYYY